MPMPLSQHIPIMVEEIIRELQLTPDALILDATVGGGGHTQAFLDATAPTGKVLGMDWDAQALKRTEKKLAQNKKRYILQQGNYRDAQEIMHRPEVVEFLAEAPHTYESGLNSFSAILLDLGLSYDQLKDQSRGFGIQTEGSLDMRFSDQESLTAREIVNTWSEDDLTHIFKTYGEERHAARVAKLIVASRKLMPLNSVAELVDVVIRGVGSRGRSRIHPATRVFQALRIATNHELENVEHGIPALFPLLKSGGRMAVLTFHSLEDRLVKHMFKDYAKQEDPLIRIITKKVIKPTREECIRNPASRSAKLRIIEKC